MRAPPPGMAWPVGLMELAPGTYAYVQAVGSAGISNAGLILGPDRAVVVDALTTTPMATAFLGSIRSVTGLPISHLLLTHHHADHFLGIQNFLPTHVVSHALCREEMLQLEPGAVEHYAALRPQFAEELHGVRVCLPDETFEHKMTLYLGEREVQFFHLGTGHTRGDGLVYLAVEKVLFAGDVAFHKVTPNASLGHIGKWIKVVDTILEMDVETIVPGHGPVGGKAELAEMRAYLQLVHDGARRCFDQGMSESEATAAIDIGAYQSWSNPERLTVNVERAYSEFRGELTV